jgi:hypothetical protein
MRNERFTDGSGFVVELSRRGAARPPQVTFTDVVDHHSSLGAHWECA